jgi:hypothetical protein
MGDIQLIFTALAELSTRQIAETMNATGMDENKVAGKKGGCIAHKGRILRIKPAGVLSPGRISCRRQGNG